MNRCSFSIDAAPSLSIMLPGMQLQVALQVASDQYDHLVGTQVL